MSLTTPLFHRIDDAKAVICRGRVYKQVDLYRRGEHAFVPHAGGYVRLLRDGMTTDPVLRWDGIEAPCGITLRAGCPIAETA